MSKGRDSPKHAGLLVLHTMAVGMPAGPLASDTAAGKARELELIATSISGLPVHMGSQG